MEQTIKKLGVERLSKDDVQRMQWEVLEAKIGNWIHFMRIAVRHSYVIFFFFSFPFVEKSEYLPIILAISYMIQVKLLFAAEKKVCDEIFEGNDSVRDQCFAEVTGNSVTVLLSFGEAIAKSKRSPEKLFVLLDMYEIMRELQFEVFIFLNISLN